MLKSGKCRLCGCYLNSQKPINSHIIPKFFYDRLKQTGFMREYSNINLPVQDGLKCEFLCSSCEQLFSRFEGSFKKDLYDSFINEDKKPVTIRNSKNLILFVISLFWRKLQFFLENIKVDSPLINGGLKEDEILLMQNKCDELKEAILNEKVSASVLERMRIFNIEASPIFHALPLVKANLSVCGDVIVHGEYGSLPNCNVFILVPHLFFVYTFRGYNYFSLDNRLTNNIVKDCSMSLPESIRGWLIGMGKTIGGSRGKLSFKQRQAVDKRLKSYLEKKGKK